LVALVVHNAARRGQQAVRARAEATLLTDFALTVMTEPDPLQLLLDKVRESFTATSVALLERNGDRWRAVAAAGTAPATTPAGAEADIAVGADLHLVLCGRVLSAAERHVLRGVAGQALLALRAQRLAAEALEARRRAEATELRSALLSAVGHDLRTPLTAIKAAVGSLRVYLGQLRQKLEPEPSRPRYLITEPGMGYRFEVGPEPLDGSRLAPS
jgi:two-component system sensor histidine kinase KdpD